MFWHAVQIDATPEETKPEVKTLTADVSKIDFVAKGNTASVTVTTNAKTWTISFRC